MTNLTENIAFTCRSTIEDDVLRLHYTVSNASPHDIYVLDTIPTTDPDVTKRIYDPNTVYLSWHKNSSAEIIKGIPPLPDRPVNHRIYPLGTKLPPSEKLERDVTLPLPLREQSPYYAPLEDDQYDKTDISRLVLTVHYVLPTIEEFKADPEQDGSGLFIVRAKHLVGQIRKLTCTLDAPVRTILKRRDWILRS